MLEVYICIYVYGCVCEKERRRERVGKLLGTLANLRQSLGYSPTIFGKQ